jgi:Hint domain
MMTRAQGTFVISWSQAELDGLVGVFPGDMTVGSTWRWHGRALRVDDRRDVLLLEGAIGVADMHRRAAGQIRRFLGDPNLNFSTDSDVDADEPLFRSGFELTDGRRKYQASLVNLEAGQPPMVLFIGAMPPADQDLWVVSCSIGGDMVRPGTELPGTICFVPGTRLSTPDGSKLVDELAEGDHICTKDGGAQPIRWIGSRQITGGRLVAMPHLRPIRLSAHVLAAGEPDQDLTVSPDHRVLVKGAVAQALFNTDEVLVAARDLVNDRTIRVDRRCRAVSYIHLMLDCHQIVWANGVEVESFHPAATDPDQIAPSQRAALLERFPDIAEGAHAYGDFARRNLTRSEAAILTYGALGGH